MGDYRDSLVTENSGFSSWADLVRSLERGYVPSIYPDGRSPRRLRYEVVSSGYRVFPDTDLVRVRLTSTQIFYLESLAFPNVTDDEPLYGKTYIEADGHHWVAVESIVGEWDFEEVHGLGSMAIENENQYAFAERSFERSQASMLKRIGEALER